MSAARALLATLLAHAAVGADDFVGTVSQDEATRLVRRAVEETTSYAQLPQFGLDP